MRFGELIGRVSSAVRGHFYRDPGMLFSLQGMAKTELLKISQDAPEVFELVKPIMLDYDHLLLEQIARNPNMTPGEVRDFLNNQFEFILSSVAAELRIRNQ